MNDAEIQRRITRAHERDNANHTIDDLLGIIEDLAAKLEDKRLEVDGNRRSLGQEICQGLATRDFWRPKDTASCDIIGAIFRAIDGLQAKLEKREALIEKALRYLSADSDADIPWDNIDEVSMSWIKGWEQKAEDALVRAETAEEKLEAAEAKIEQLKADLLASRNEWDGG